LFFDLFQLILKAINKSLTIENNQQIEKIFRIVNLISNDCDINMLDFTDLYDNQVQFNNIIKDLSENIESEKEGIFKNFFDMIQKIRTLTKKKEVNLDYN